MTRILVVGAKDDLERTIRTMYDLKLLHLVDHRGGDDVIGIGKPLPSAAEVSENLVKLRSIVSLLGIEEVPGKEPATPIPENLRLQIMTLELNLREQDDARKRIEALLQELDVRAEELAPFATLALPLRSYAGYESIEAIVGRVEEDVQDLGTVTPEHEALRVDRLIAVLVAKEAAERMREHLARFGFTPLAVPKGQGEPGVLLSAVRADREKWAARLAETQDRIAKLRDKYAGFLVAAEGYLRVEIEKAEAPLRFAASEHSFLVDGWVPTSRVKEFTTGLAAMPGLHVEVLGEPAATGEDDAPPVLLRNRGPVRRFEFLTNLYSTPRHDEIDPTAFLFLLFPVFFGLMIGDAGYGIALMALGFGMSRMLKDNPDFADLMRVVLYGGIFALLFGIFLFGEVFGIPFHAPPEQPGEVSWSAILGNSIPYWAPIHKLEQVGVIDLLLLSIVASFVHLALGFVIGFVDEIHHDRKHAASRIGWLLVLVGLLTFFAVLGRAPEGSAASHRVVNQLFFNQPPLVWVPAQGLAIGGLAVPFTSLAFVLVGIGILLPTEGPLAPIESISLLANMMSYTRLAGVAVAKGALAFAFNTMLLPLILNMGLWEAQHVVVLNPNVGLIVLGFVFLFLAHSMVMVLGAISAGIQSLRLSYVEFFLKFFKGGGTLFSPFGARRPMEV